ncbi:MAG TPA: PAS domain-containing protein [Anaerolineae bacterium]|nr:PAS domain-containing protein [Anaerolineae bacterium]
MTPSTPLTTVLPELHRNDFLDITTDVCLLISHHDNSVAWANRAAYTALDYQETDVLIGAGLGDLLVHNGIQFTREMLVSMAANSSAVLVGLLARDGRHVNMGLVAAREDRGKTHTRIILRPIAQSIDICAECGKLTAAEGRVEALSLRIRTILNRAPIGFLFLDRTYNIQWANTYFLDTTHWPLRELIRLSLDEITPPERIAFRHRMLEAALKDDGQKKAGFTMYVRDYFNEGRYWKFDVEILPEVAALSSIVIYMRQIRTDD